MRLPRLFHFAAAAALLALAGVALGPAWAHPGGMAGDGAHRDRATGERHWHLDVPCVADPCNVGIVPYELIDHLDPIPDECPALFDRIVTEAQSNRWLGPSYEDIAQWAVRGLKAGCWRVPRAPPGGESHT